jgi:hypothetical protein
MANSAVACGTYAPGGGSPTCMFYVNNVDGESMGAMSISGGCVPNGGKLC